MLSAKCPDFDSVVCVCMMGGGGGGGGGLRGERD